MRSFSIFYNLRKNIGQAFSGFFALRLYTNYNHCLCPRPAQVAPQQCKQDVVLRIKTLSMLDSHWWNLRGKNNRENCWDYFNQRAQQYKSGHVSALMGPMLLKMAKERQRVSTPCWNWTHVTWLTANCLIKQLIDLRKVGIENLKMHWT